jgi:hypothetical protein
MFENTLNWVRGLSEYLNFVGDEDAKKFVDFIEKCMYAEQPVINATNDAGMVEFISVLRKFAPNEIFDIFHKYFRSGEDPAIIQDAFSRGQVLSKIWLVTELAKIQKDFKMVFVHAGWLGQIRLYLDHTKIEYEKMRIFDIDPIAMKLSDKVFNNAQLQDWKVKSALLNVNDYDSIQKTGIQYQVTDTITEKNKPDLIINTSCEHFSDSWYHKFKSRSEGWGTLIAIQTNNFHKIEDHINTVHSLEEVKMKYPMDEILYEGELELNGYTRYMLIGKNK